MLRDLLWAVRWLRHNPLFTLAIVAILALGIGANTAVFSMIDAVLLRPLPYASPGTLAAVKETSNKQPAGGMPASDYPDPHFRRGGPGSADYTAPADWPLR
jgi:hypothetical protein